MNDFGVNSKYVRQPARKTTRIKLYDIADVRAVIGADTSGEVLPDEFTTTQDSEHFRRVSAILAKGDLASERHLLGPALNIAEEMSDLVSRAPHFEEFVTANALAAFRIRLPMAFNPILLVGEPGIGKSFFLRKMALLLGLPFRSYSMSISTLGDGISGSHPCWRNADMGLVAKTLLHETFANPVIFIDEFDKTQTNGWVTDPYRPFYTLFETSCSTKFVDEYLQFPVDASHVIWIMAANVISQIPAPILDRLTVIHVPSPTLEQRIVVIQSIYELANASRKNFYAKRLKWPVLDKLLALNPRGIRIAIETGMAFAAADGRRILRADDIKSREAKPMFKAGFC
jgi:ATP-dependent Lon protease